MRSLSRRTFLERGGKAAAITLAASPAAAVAQSGDLTPRQEDRLAELSEQAADQKALLYDSTLCIGCRACEMACNEKNTLGRTEEEIFEGRGAEDARALAPDVYTYVTYHEVAGDPSSGAFGKVQCMHCIEPACVSSCPVHALEKTEEGPVIYNRERCLGCRYCELACPFLVPRFEWDKASPYIRKCDMCADLQAEGSAPACVDSCPTGALIWGTRTELLREARVRIITNPRQYEHHIFGEQEAGGTDFLHIAARPFDDLGYRRDLPLKSYRDYTRQSMLSVPYVLSTLAVSLGAVAWMVNRHEKADEAQRTRAGERTLPDAPGGEEGGVR